MSKQCKICGVIVPDDARFCQSCGSSEFSVNNPQQQVDINATQQPMNVNNANYQANHEQNQYSQSIPVNQTWQNPTPQNPPKKNKTGLIIGIVAAVLIVLAIIGSVAEDAFQKEGYGDDTNNDGDYSFNIDVNTSTSIRVNDSTETSSEKVKVAYTKGTFDGSVYENKWADIKFALPNGFSNADSTVYSATENANAECGAYFLADDTMGLIFISFEKLPTTPVYDEEAYLDVSMSALKNVTDVTYNKIPETYSTVGIGGYTYVKAECEFSNTNGNFTNTFYVRKLDNYMIVISAIGVDAEYNDNLINKITNAN